MIVDHALCNMVDGSAPLPESIVSCGILNWTGVLPEALATRLDADLLRIQQTQAERPIFGAPPYPYTPSALHGSELMGYDTMTNVTAAIAAALLQGRTVIGHGLLSFGWQFFKPFLPAGDDTAYDHLLLSNVYDTANIEKAIQDDDPDWLPEVGLPFAEWQRNCGAIRSKQKWSLRTHMFHKYGCTVPARACLAIDIMEAYVHTIGMWRAECGQVQTQR